MEEVAFGPINSNLRLDIHVKMSSSHVSGAWRRDVHWR